MSATVGELLAEAERHVWDLASEPTPDSDALGAAWPLFQRRSHAALAAAPPIANTVALKHYNGLARSARQIRERGIDQLRDAAPHPGIQRAAQLLGAAADLLHGTVTGETGLPGATQAEAWQARIAEMIHTTAHTTRIALTRDPGTWGAGARTRRHATELKVIEYHAAAISAQVLPEHRRTLYDDLAAPRPRLDGQLDEVLAVWHAQATATLDPANPTPSVVDIQRVTVDLALLAAHTRVIVTADAAQRGIDPDTLDRLNQDFVAVAHGWRDILESWPARIFGAATATDTQAAASDALRSTLNTITRPDGRWLDATELAARTDHWSATTAAARQSLDSMHHLAASYAQLPAAHAGAGKLYAPARALCVAAREVDGVPMTAAQQELLTARRRGRWVVLQPADVHHVTAATAHQPDRTRQLRDDVRSTLGVDRRSVADQTVATARHAHPNTWAPTGPAPERTRNDGWRAPHRQDRTPRTDLDQ